MCANLLHEQLANIQKKWENTKYHARLSSAANNQSVSQSVSQSGLQYMLVIIDIIDTNYCHTAIPVTTGTTRNSATRDNIHYSFQSHSRSLITISTESPYATYLSLNNTNIHHISYPSQVIAHKGKIIASDRGCLYLMHLFSVISPITAISHILLKTIDSLDYISVADRQYGSIFNHFDVTGP